MNQHCLICDVRVVTGGSDIFGDGRILESGKILADMLSQIVDRPIIEGSTHSNILCKKCHRSCTEYDIINNRLEQIKSQVLWQFKNSLPKYDIDYESYGVDGSSVKSEPIFVEKKIESKKLVLPASKLQPLPPDYILKVGKLASIGTQKIVSAKSLTTPLKIVISSPSSIQSRNTITTTKKTEHEETTLTDQRKTADKQPTIKISALDNLGAVNTRSILNYNASLPKDFLSSATPKSDDEKGVHADAEVDLENNDEHAMEIDEDCSYTVVLANTEADPLKSPESSDDKSKATYLDVDALSTLSESREESRDKCLLGELALVNRDSDTDDEEEHTIVMDGDSGSILRVVSGQQFLYGDGEISLVVSDDQRTQSVQDNGDSRDSNDESQIELQVSGDEETANAIIAAAHEQGGALIKVESGAMFRVKSVQSAGDQEDVDHVEPIVEKLDNKKFKCLLCDKSETKDASKAYKGDAVFMTQHMKTEHNARLYICHVCGELLRKRTDYGVHIAAHAESVSKNKMQECSVCKKRYGSRTLLVEHMNMHTGARPHQCRVCAKSFASKYTLQAHLKTHLERARPHKCEQCGKSFFTIQNLQQHQKTHSGVKDFVCKICGKAFGTQHNLEVHGVVHSGRKPYVCGACGKGFARRAEVQDHLRVHTGERPFACEVCGATFSQRSNLYSHKRATHYDDKRHLCPHCPKRFKRRRLLDYHIKASHTGERPLKCELCTATFVYPEHYKKHIRIHSGEKPYQCEICGKTFNSRDNRNTHRFVHSDKKPYECLVCGAGYMRKQLLYAHMNTRGHLAESIVVNQPRVTNVADNALFETSTSEIPVEIDTNLTKTAEKPTINIVQENQEPTVLTIHNVDDLKADGELLERVEQLAEQTQIVANDENGAMLRLVQIQLPDGNNGWVALNP